MSLDIATFDPFAGAPRINTPRRIGVRPGTEVIQHLAVTGARPLTIDVTDLPPGVRLDDGVCRGTAPSQPGVWQSVVTATNATGTATATVDWVVGDLLALTPPLGWNSWNVFAKEVSASVIVEVAHSFAESGLADLGYHYLNIDDHWHAERRGPGGVPEANPHTFPDGVGAVAEAVHALGLKLGIYSDAAHLTCGKCFGGHGYERVDAEAYAEWGIDLLKYDYCHAPKAKAVARERYRAMGDALASCGRSVVFSVIEWGLRRPWTWAASVGGNYWRTTPDIFDSFGLPTSGVRDIARHNMTLDRFARPGAWNDPDMLLIGNRGNGLSTSHLRPLLALGKERPAQRFKGLSDVEAVTHLTMWSMMASPLLASHDPTTVSDFDLNLLRNPEIVAINQDPLGVQARRARGPIGLWILVKPLADGSHAVSLTHPWLGSRKVEIRLGELGLDEPSSIVDIWSGADLGQPGVLRAKLAGHGTAAFIVRPTGQDHEDGSGPAARSER